jgi:Phage integrase family
LEEVSPGPRTRGSEPGAVDSAHNACVPLNDEAMRVLAAQRGKHPSRVFTCGGQPIKQVSTKAWYHALERAGIEDFRWHDLRHTWASWHVQNGTPLYLLQELGVGRPKGWCAVTRIWLRNTSRHTRPTRKATAQLRHNHRISAAQPDCNW